jgi:hypothetical protein
MRGFLFIIVFSCILSLPNLSHAIPDGDLTGDGAVTIADALRALRISVALVQPPTTQDLAQGDVAPQLGGLPDPDGNINISDALFILRKVVGLVNWPSDLSALLSGDQETPPVTTAATGVGTVSVDPLTKIISGGIATSGIIGIAAHIHDGDTGVPGGVVIPLVGGPTVWTIPANTVLTDPLLARLLAGGLYFNVHTATNPGGEIRGQINQQVRFASLNGASEVPANASTATGTAVLAMNPVTGQVAGFIRTTGIVGIAAHFHSGAVGVNGPVVVGLVETPLGSGLWTIPAGSTLPVPQTQAALFNIGSLYYNVHSTLFPGGEIRGQIIPTSFFVGTATLDGAQEVPPVTTAATGTGVAILNGVTMEIRGDIAPTGVVGTAAQLQQGISGVVGPVIASMTEAVTVNGTFWSIPDNTPPLSPILLGDFIASGLYYNVLSTLNPTGEIRGQINASPSGIFRTGGGITTAAPLP